MTLSFQNWHDEIDEFWPEHSKVSKIFTLIRFWVNYIFFELKKYKENIFHETEVWCKISRRIDMLFQTFHEEFGKFWHKHSEV